MTLSGIQTIFTPLTPMSGPLGYVYSTRLTLVIFGIIILTSGLTLIIAKIRHNKRWTGRALMAIYLCYLFATLLQGFAFNWAWDYWGVNMIMTLITGALWLRWKFKTEYINPKHFRE